jgi:hypothetical protein
LLTSIAALEYPREKLEIQVLDDSTDDSVIDTANLILKLANTGLISNTLPEATDMVLKLEP